MKKYIGSWNAIYTNGDYGWVMSEVLALQNGYVGMRGDRRGRRRGIGGRYGKGEKSWPQKKEGDGVFALHTPEDGGEGLGSGEGLCVR